MAALRKRDPQAVAVVSSGYSKDIVMSNYSEAGFAGSLPKPFTIAGLGRILRQVLGDRVTTSARNDEFETSG